MFDVGQIRAAVVVTSDSRSSGLRQDETGPAAAAALSAIGLSTARVLVIPDDRAVIVDTLRSLAASSEIALVITAGGTGLAPRDVTPEATRDIVEKAVPGIPEMLRQRSLSITPKAALSRGIAGIVNRTLIVNLPGSPKAVRESIAFLAPVLPHALETLLGLAVECRDNSR